MARHIFYWGINMADMAGNGWMWLEMAGNCGRWLAMPKVTFNDRKFQEMD